MPNTRQGSIHLFRFAGVDLFLHWSWFLVAAYEIERHSRYYTSITWNILEYLALFSIVLMHEFGHALACRQVGGTANQILLWPFGGVAYVNPPQRPGATLWSIAAGPLVNVALLLPLYAAVKVGHSVGWAQTMHDPYNFLRAVFYINLSLLVFNLLPIYPLDGGQILRSLLWFVFGRGRSLMIATILGFLGIAGFIGLRLFDTLPVVDRDLNLSVAGLLERITARAVAVAARENTTPGGICLSKLPDGATGGSEMEMRTLRATLRYI